ncbi:MAG: TIGR04552 family protein [Nannocystaceae bacterium]
MNHPRSRVASTSGAFPCAEACNASDRAFNPRGELSLQHRREIRLLLRGDSVVDWHRLDYQNESEVRRMLALNSLDVDDSADSARLADLRARAVAYVSDTLGLHISNEVGHEVAFLRLPILASGHGWEQRQACVLLKVMHIIYHLDARELRTRLPIADSDLFGLVEESVSRMFDELREARVPLAEFSWSRKTRASLVTKLLVKPQTRAARVFDRLRFRLIVKRPCDLGPALHVMLRRFIPFNYVVPGQTVSTLVELAENDPSARSSSDFVRLVRDRPEASAPHPTDTSPSSGTAPATQPRDVGNEFSSDAFRVLNFVADLPVRVDDLIVDPHESCNVVFVLAEFQILDEATANTNDRAESAHALYKERQHARVRQRLLQAPSGEKPHPGGDGGH